MIRPWINNNFLPRSPTWSMEGSRNSRIGKLNNNNTSTAITQEPAEAPTSL